MQVDQPPCFECVESFMKENLYYSYAIPLINLRNLSIIDFHI
jgi:hypothetical protein